MRTEHATPYFPGMLNNQRQSEIQRHFDLLALCWPQWEGPKVGEFCEVHSVFAFSVTHGAERYHFMEPVLITAISPDQETISAVLPNGEELRLDILQIWAPVRELSLKTTTTKK